MKVLFNCPTPFNLAHGGAQIQIEQTMRSLEKLGVCVEPLRWWEENQKAGLIHFFGRIPAHHIEMAHRKGIKVIISELLSQTCNRSSVQLAIQGLIIKSALALPFAKGIKNRLNWGVYKRCDRCIVGLEAEGYVLQKVFGVSSEKVSVLPLGLSENHLRISKGPRNGSHLVYCGTITAQKNCIELAELAKAARVPVLFVGKPYSEIDPYWLRFRNLIDNELVKHHPFVTDELKMIQLLNTSRGYVMMSDYENWSLSAHEAVARGLPLLVQDQKWSRERFGNQARYFAKIGFCGENVKILQKFWHESPAIPAPNIRLYTWKEVAEQLASIYEQTLNG